MSVPSPSPLRRSRAAVAGSALTAALSVSLLTGSLSPASADVVAPTVAPAATAAVPAASMSVAATQTLVTIGESTRRLSGTNIMRSGNRLVLFKSPRTVTTKTKRGVDVVVKAGRVVKVNVRRPGRGRARVAIPSGGFVVSGAGSAASWLRSVARVGATVTVERRTADGVVAPAPGVLVSGATMAVGSSSRKLTGVNVERTTNALVAYRTPLAATPTNAWGMEVGVSDGRIVSLNDRQRTSSATGTAVPAGGYVLSAHGTTADWLRAYAKVGTVVTAGGRAVPNAPAPTAPAPTTPAPTTPAPTTPAPTTPAVSPLVAGVAVAVGSASRSLTGVNIDRAVNAFVAYRSPLTVTPTNEWGLEVAVVGDRVTALNDRQVNGGVATPVPAGGYVLSAHGEAGDWLRGVARVGTVVTVGAGTPATPAPTAPAPTTPAPTNPAPTAPTPTTPAPTTPAPAATSAPQGLPAKVQALYHMMWSNSGSPLLRNTPSQVNVVNLSFLQGDKPRMVGWGSQSEASFIADAAALRARGVRIVASVGGAGGHVNLANRETFVQGVMELNAKVPLDGLDWDIEGSTPMAASDVVWISKRLKELRGDKFAITLAPNGSNIDQYRAIAVQLQANGALDMIGQQFYDAVVSKEAAKGRIAQLVAAGIPQSKIAVGMMVGSADVYWTVEECLTVVQFIKATYPGIRGGYLWEAGRAGTADWSTRLSSLLRS